MWTRPTSCGEFTRAVPKISSRLHHIEATLATYLYSTLQAMLSLETAQRESDEMGSAHKSAACE